MNKKINLTVFLMFYNPGNFLKKSLISLIKQTYRPFKIILILDYPKKNEIEYDKKKFEKDSKSLKKFKKDLKKKEIDIELILRKKNFGPDNNARDALLNKIKTKYLYVQSQNDFIVDKSFFYNSIKFLEKNQDCSLAIHNSSTIIDTKIKKTRFDFIKKNSKNYSIIKGVTFLKYFKFLNFANNYCTTMYNFNSIKKNGYLSFYPKKNIYKKNDCFWEDFEFLIYFALIKKNLAITNKVSSFIIDHKSRVSRHSKFKPGSAFHNRSAAFSRFLLLHKLKNKDLRLSIILQLLLHWSYSPKSFFGGFYRYFNRFTFVALNLFSIFFFKVFYGISYKIKYFTINFIRLIARKLFFLELKKNDQN
tara:strand:+ start:5017 stop:6102 length:1086 start_codon:yes stop_codon:yes gene_type:complete